MVSVADSVVAEDSAEEEFSKMLKYLSLSLTMLCVAGCSTFSSLHQPISKHTSLEPPSVSVNHQPELADPRDQELAIALETAKLAEQRGMDREAVDAFLQVRNLDPSQPDVAHSLAVLYDRLGMTDAASREYQAALEEDPSNADVHCDFGYFLYSTGEAEQAETSLKEALRLQPDHSKATINLALVVGSLARYDEAQELFTQAIGPAAAMHNVGMLRLRAGEVEAAKTMLAEAKRRDPSIEASQPVLDQLCTKEDPKNTPKIATANANALGNNIVGGGVQLPSASNPKR